MAMPVSGPVFVELLEDGRLVRVVNELRYIDSKGRLWIVPANFISDGASIPQPLWSAIGSPLTGRYRIAALFHDAAYQTLGVSEQDANEMFRELMLVCGTSHLEAELIYQGVKQAGLSSYVEDQRQAALKLSGVTA